MSFPYYIAIDFDGTLTDKNIFPDISEPNAKVINDIQQLISSLTLEGYRVVKILWTCREDLVGDRQYLTEALEWCKQNIPFEFDYVNENPEITFGHKEKVRKIVANLYIDDKAVGLKELSAMFN